MVVQVSFRSFLKGITLKICMLCFVLINNIFQTFYVFVSCFRMLAVILVSDFSIQLQLCSWSGKCPTIFLIYFFVTQLRVFLVFSKITRSVQLLSVCSVVSGKQSFWEFGKTDICANAVRMNSPRDAKVSRPMMVFLKVGKDNCSLKLPVPVFSDFPHQLAVLKFLFFKLIYFCGMSVTVKYSFYFACGNHDRITDIDELFLQSELQTLVNCFCSESFVVSVFFLFL